MAGRWKILAIGGAAALAVAALAWLAMERGPLATVEVRTAQAAVAELRPTVFGVGTVEARFAYSIGPTQAGRVLKMHVDHGDTVRAGQLVAEMDPVDLSERARSAEAQAREAESRARTAQASFERYRDLAARKFVSAEAADARRNEADVAAGALAAARATAQGARAQLGNSRLTSPVDGIVVAREAEPGSTLVAGQAALRIVDPRSLWIMARIDQGRARGLRVGQKASIELRSARSQMLPGTVARIDLQSDAVTEERLVAVQLDEAPATLFLGELAEVTIRLPAVADALAVPSAAISRRNGGSGVWQVAGGRTRFVPVVAGVQTADGSTQILEGLAAGDEVIVHSTALLQEDMRVRIKKP